jgi:hypothetical protein
MPRVFRERVTKSDKSSSLPDFWQALKLDDTIPGPEGSQVPSAPPYPSITEAFNILMVNNTMEYIESTMSSWVSAAGLI